MKNKILFLIIIAFFAILFFSSEAVLASVAQGYVDNIFTNVKATLKDYPLPELDGLYDVPERADLKLRVIVHYEKPIKSELPSLVCNLSDPESYAAVSKASWKLPKGTWVYTLNPYSVPLAVGKDNLKIMASDAFNRWSGATGFSNKVLFSQSPIYTVINRAKMDGKNIIAWGRTQGTALGVTYTWYYPSTGIAVETDTIMNNKFKWSWSDPATNTACGDSATYDAQNILTHELGHWMGLADMYSLLYQNATMYGYGSKAEIKKDTLSSGDIAGIKSIYPN